MPINFRYSPISREARAAGVRFLDLTSGYECLVVPRGVGVTTLAVLGMVARARNLLRVTHNVADTGDAATTAILVRTLTESVLTLGWFDRDPELAELVWMLDEIRTRLHHHDEVASEERRQRARARRRREDVAAVAAGRSLGLLTRANVRDLHRQQREVRAKLERLPRLAARKRRLRVGRVDRMPGFGDRAKVAEMPWVYSLAYRFDSNSAAHPTPLTLEQFFEMRPEGIAILAAGSGERPDPYFVSAQLMSALLEFAGRRIDQTEIEEGLEEVRAELEGLRRRASEP